MSTAPLGCGPVVAVKLPEVVTVTEAAATPPMVSVEPGTKFAPEICTVVPPAELPEAG